jgi:hypothetical protein
MKLAWQIFLLVAGLLQAAPVLAQEPAASPLLGKWAVDVSKLPIPPEARPKSVTFTYTDIGNGTWTTKVDIVTADGSASHGVATYKLDGTLAPVVGSPEADTTAVMMPATNVLVMALSNHGHPGSTRVYTVAADGKTQTESVVYFGPDGKPVTRTNYFTRIR